MESHENHEKQPNKQSYEDEIDKRRPKPFRYITNLSEISNEEAIASESVMSTKSDFTVEKLMEQFDSVVGIGDVGTIEKVIQKHEKRNRKHDPSIE